MSQSNPPAVRNPDTFTVRSAMLHGIAHGFQQFCTNNFARLKTGNSSNPAHKVPSRLFSSGHTYRRFGVIRAIHWLLEGNARVSHIFHSLRRYGSLHMFRETDQPEIAAVVMGPRAPLHMRYRSYAMAASTSKLICVADNCSCSDIGQSAPSLRHAISACNSCNCPFCTVGEDQPFLVDPETTSDL